ncbi:hypothetical protein [Paraburkholderia humisilvae]|uniref:Uncharacterized protein n=1 Tax=Paraburkholderia humisilvae TaxID=627669 RepID=A0A6J5E765_9BURK|nr:hypothetical protein [Paraburkholderia humisilvae]CAB3762193.1 hypothetical protein LMG29542_04273 [Paraburkholderia humisilvae]
MTPPSAVAIDSFKGFELTADGQYLILNSNQPDRIALHCSVMHELLAALSNAIGSSERIRSKKKSVKFAMPCEAWALGKDAGGKPYLIFTFRLPGGAELSFQLHRSQAAHMTEVLALATGLAKGSDLSGLRLQ